MGNGEEEDTIRKIFQGGSIFIVDLEARKCMVELSAPQSIHNVEIVKYKDRIDLLVRIYRFYILLNGGYSMFYKSLSL